MEHTGPVRTISFTVLLLAVVWFFVSPGFEPAITALLGAAGLLSTRARPSRPGALNRQAEKPQSSRPTRESPPDPKSVAVLPLRNIGDDPENEFFSDGLTEDIIARLSHIDDLTVISRTSVMRFKHSTEPMIGIGRSLGVGTILEGSVRRAEERLRVVVQLIDARSDRQLWAETFDRELDDVFAIQSEIALHVAEALKASLTPDEEARIMLSPTESLTAHDLYLLGRHHWWSFMDGGPLIKSIKHFEQSLDLDQSYAPAQAGLAYAYLVAGPGGGDIMPWSEAMPRAKKAAQRAIDLDPGLGEAHGTLAMVHAWLEWDWQQALEAGQRGVEAEPSSSIAWGGYAHVLSLIGDREASVAAGKRFVDLDPLAVLAHHNLAQHLFNARRPDEACVSAQRCLELDPDFLWAHTILSDIHVWKGDVEAALSHVEPLSEVAKTTAFVAASLGTALAAAGRSAEFREVASRLEMWAGEGKESWAAAAVPYIWADEHDHALDLVLKVSDQRPPPSSWPCSLLVWPLYDPVRQDERFQSALGALGFSRSV